MVSYWHHIEWGGSAFAKSGEGHLMQSVASGKWQRMIDAQNREIGKKIWGNGESGLQEKNSTEPVADECAENGTDADCRAEKNGTDANSFADAEHYADVRAVPRADAGIDEGKKSVGNMSCTILTQ